MKKTTANKTEGTLQLTFRSQEHREVGKMPDSIRRIQTFLDNLPDGEVAGKEEVSLIGRIKTRTLRDAATSHLNDYCIYPKLQNRRGHGPANITLCFTNAKTAAQWRSENV